MERLTCVNRALGNLDSRRCALGFGYDRFMRDAPNNESVEGAVSCIYLVLRCVVTKEFCVATIASSPLTSTFSRTVLRLFAWRCTTSLERTADNVTMKFFGKYSCTRSGTARKKAPGSLMTQERGNLGTKRVRYLPCHDPPIRRLPTPLFTH